MPAKKTTFSTALQPHQNQGRLFAGLAATRGRAFSLKNPMVAYPTSMLRTRK
jgi:hypothetical protein